eukprot:TRINITY_DN44081_c0_g1_i1.p1 TRINITY_DN44081_c0_g1~~TRINITY_DN44081_c0_g1_i1.p1  ORF type:complete len:112 (-),score=1.10 TRINITY_DN44081_c0_g1_i1:183-518(-)
MHLRACSPKHDVARLNGCDCDDITPTSPTAFAVLSFFLLLCQSPACCRFRKRSTRIRTTGLILASSELAALLEILTARGIHMAPHACCATTPLEEAAHCHPTGGREQTTSR